MYRFVFDVECWPSGEDFDWILIMAFVENMFEIILILRKLGKIRIKSVPKFRRFIRYDRILVICLIFNER